MSSNEDVPADVEALEDASERSSQSEPDLNPEDAASDDAAHEHQQMDVGETSEAIESERYCRICFDHEDDEDNPLISPCNCTGSQKYIHSKCLKTWQFSVQISSPNHPLFQSQDERHKICSVCRQPFNCPPASRMDIIAEISGVPPRYISSGLALISTENENLLRNSESPTLLEVLFHRRWSHWNRAVYLITRVVQETEGQLLPGDAVKGVNVTAIMDATDNVREIQSELNEFISSLGSTESKLEPYYFRGGPVMPDHALAVGFVSSVDGMQENSSVSVICQGEQSFGIFGDAKEVALMLSECGIQKSDKEGKICVPVYIFLGHATWTRMQLLGEISRGSWGILPHDSVHDISLLLRVDLDEQDESQGEAPISHRIGLWRRMLQSGLVVYAQNNRMKDEFLERRRELMQSLSQF